MKKSKLLVLALMLVVLVSVCLAGCQQTESTPTTEATEAPPPVMEAYYNVDGATYNNNGVSSRPAEADGTYKVLFSRKGKPVTMTVKADQELINKIDSLNVLGLVVDESKVVTGVKTVEEMGGKIVYDGYYIYVTGRATIVIHEKSDYSDAGVELAVPSNQTVFTDLVTDPTKPDKTTYGDLMRGDQIFAVQDYEGKITDVFFYKGGLIRTGIDQYCPHCCEEGQTVHFDAWTQTSSSIQKSAHLFLYQDLELADQVMIGQNLYLVLDLNGYTVFDQNPTKRILTTFGENTYFGLMDSSEAKTGRVLNDHTQLENGLGATVWVNKGVFELFGGTIDATKCTSSGYGAAVAVLENGKFIMHEGGVILGGTTIANMQKDDGTVINGGGHGGAVYCTGVFEMYGGKIEGGTAVANGTNRGRGGCLAIGGSGVFNMYGGEIIGGYDDGGFNEGLMYKSNSATFNQTGGTIKEAPPKTETPSETPSTEG